MIHSIIACCLGLRIGNVSSGSTLSNLNFHLSFELLIRPSSTRCGLLNSIFSLSFGSACTIRFPVVDTGPNAFLGGLGLAKILMMEDEDCC